MDNLNHQLGTDRPILTQYWDWLSGVAHGDFGAVATANRR